MQKLKWIEIQNFRGFKLAKLTNLGDINIFIGKNNTGKSAILESIYLISTGLRFKLYNIWRSTFNNNYQKKALQSIFFQYLLRISFL